MSAAITVRQTWQGWIVAGGGLLAPAAWGIYETEGEARAAAFELAEDLGYDVAAHSAYWAQCEDCERRTLELEAEGLTRSDAQAAAEAEHMNAQAVQA
jgi:hypothetical protein